MDGKEKGALREGRGGMSVILIIDVKEKGDLQGEDDLVPTLQIFAHIVGFALLNLLLGFMSFQLVMSLTPT
jgi:hypothetical protein